MPGWVAPGPCLGLKRRWLGRRSSADRLDEGLGDSLTIDPLFLVRRNDDSLPSPIVFVDRGELHLVRAHRHDTPCPARQTCVRIDLNKETELLRERNFEKSHQGSIRVSRYTMILERLELIAQQQR